MRHSPFRRLALHAALAMPERVEHKFAEVQMRMVRPVVAALEAEGDPDRLALARLLHQRLRQPQSYVTVVGETETPLSAIELIVRLALTVTSP